MSTDHLFIGAATEPPAEPPADPRVTAYMKALRAIDWSYEMSDDDSVWLQQQRRNRMWCVSEQRCIDLDFAIWNAHVPANRRHRAPAPGAST